MDTATLTALLCDLIRIPSITGAEGPVMGFVEQFCRARGWRLRQIPVSSGRFNLLIGESDAKVVLSTHLDVVPAPDELFCPRCDGVRIIGRGACDAKGIAASMLAAYETLIAQGESSVGLLFVVGEEVDGIGARVAARELQGTGVAVIINGEPTEGKLARAHKGALDAVVRFSGRSCHSGYPELGLDANAEMLKCAHRLLTADFGYSPEFGGATVNVGSVSGGHAANIISDHAELQCCVRTVGKSNDSARQLFETLCAPAVPEIRFDAPPVVLETVPGFETAVMAYASDIPNFLPLGCRMLMYGPGSILVAHTDEEFVAIAELEQAVEGYVALAKHYLS